MNQGRDCRAILLPVDLVGKVLSFVDQKQRILTCSLVSRTWNQAVKAATRTLSCRLRVSVEDQHLSNWLSSNSYVSQIESIHVDSVASHCRQGRSTLPVLQLPLHKLGKLQALKLRLCRLQPASMAEAASYTDGHAAPLVSLAGLTALTQLRFDHCIAEVCNLSSCTALQHLEICFPLTPGSLETTADGVPTSAEAMLAAALPQLQHLTHLSLRSSSLSRPAHLQFPAFSSVLSNLQQLQSLQLGPYVKTTTASLAHLPVSLSSLYIDSTHGYDTMLAPEVTPQLRQLTCLSRLQIDHLYNFNPALLSSYPSLTWLMLKELAFEDRESVSVLLSALQKMSQLRHLDLHDSIQKAVREPELYAALTASRYLTYLDIGQCCLSVRAAQAIFKPDYPCQGLQSLIICAHQVRAAANMELLVRCCPALEYLEITNYNAHTGRIDQEGLTALQALTALTYLSFFDVLLSDNAMLSITKCQQLDRLELYVSNVSDAGMMHVTSMTALRSLSFIQWDNDHAPELHLDNKAAAGCPPDVHQQLKNHLKQKQEMEKREMEADA